VLLLAVVAVSSVWAQRYDIPPRPGGPVLDQGELLSRADENRLAQKLTTYTDTTSTALVVVTLPSLNGAPISDYAVVLGREWGIGQEGKDNGVVVLVSKADRKVFIATGYGLEGAIPDAIANRIVDGIITPEFRQGRFYTGLDRGTDAIIQAAAGEFTADAVPASDGGDRGMPALGFVLLIILYFVVSSMWRGGPGNKGGKKKQGRHDGDFDFPIIFWGGGGHRGGGGFGGGGGFDGGGFGGFGGGGFGGGGAGGSW
jgi:uncharacterized protein